LSELRKLKVFNNTHCGVPDERYSTGDAESKAFVSTEPSVITN